MSDDIETLSAEQLVCDIRDRVQELRDRCRRLLGSRGDRFLRTCLAHVEMAIDHDHHWLDRADNTLVQLADALDDAEADAEVEAKIGKKDAAAGDGRGEG